MGDGFEFVEGRQEVAARLPGPAVPFGVTDGIGMLLEHAQLVVDCLVVHAQVLGQLVGIARLVQEAAHEADPRWAAAAACEDIPQQPVHGAGVAGAAKASSIVAQPTHRAARHIRLGLDVPSAGVLGKRASKRNGRFRVYEVDFDGGSPA
jgi:hypothetical protein